MAGATNPGNIGHAWVKVLWVDHVPPPGFDRPEKYDAKKYDFIRAYIADNPIYANDADYRGTLEALLRAHHAAHFAARSASNRCNAGECDSPRSSGAPPAPDDHR
jgi:hypothetical protein